MPVIPATREAEAGESLDAGMQRLPLSQKKKKNYWIISVIPASQNQFSLFSHFTLIQIINSARGHLVNIRVSYVLVFFRGR